VIDQVILHGNLLLPDGVREDWGVGMRGEKIVAVAPSAQFTVPADASILDAGGLYVSPGFIDAHCHGAIGFDFMTCSADELQQVLAWEAARGVTGILPTLASSPLDEELDMVRRLGEAYRHPTRGAAVLGLHLEGPYLHPEKRGAQPAASIRLPDLPEMQALVEASGQCVRLVTLAPELPRALELVRYLAAQGIVVSAGHTNATYAEMLAGIAAGVTRVAHLYNGMTVFGHREPGAAGAALEQAQVYAEIVLDGFHVHPAAARIALRSKGLERLVLVSDATQAAGQGDGVYIRPGNRKIIVQDGAARLESGALAGSTLAMDRAVANAATFLNLPIHQAVQLASLNAAKSLGLADRGLLAPGYRGDVVLFDRQISIQATFVNGQKVNSV
jgi:N-acetylglucosamine-6-phosphate deacetylase